jgi:hypothetical protein
VLCSTSVLDELGVLEALHMRRCSMVHNRPGAERRRPTVGNSNPGAATQLSGSPAVPLKPSWWWWWWWWCSDGCGDEGGLVAQLFQMVNGGGVRCARCQRVRRWRRQNWATCCRRHLFLTMDRLRSVVCPSRALCPVDTRYPVRCSGEAVTTTLTTTRADTRRHGKVRWDTHRPISNSESLSCDTQR